MEFLDSDFKKSTFSPGEWILCVLVAKKDGQVAVRDSKDPNKTTLTFSEAEWGAFLSGVKNNEFD